MKILMFFLTAFLIAGYAYAQASDSQHIQTGDAGYTLEDFYRFALDNAEKIKISQEDLNIAELGKDKAVSALIPRLSVFGAFTKYSASRESSSGTVLQPDTSVSWGLKVDRSLSLSGRELTGLKISKENIGKSMHELLAVKEAYLLNVAAAYYETVRAKKAVEIARINVERLKKYRDAAQLRLNVGEATRTVLLRAQAELSGAQSELVRAENNLTFVMALLARVGGIRGGFIVNETEVAPAEAVEPLERLKETALAERAELKAAEIQKKIAQDYVRFTAGAYWPAVTFEGVYLRRQEDPASAFLNKESIYGGLKLEFPFYEGGLRKAEVNEAEAKARQAELFALDLKQNIEIEVTDAYLTLRTQKGILKFLEDQFTFARDNYTAVSRQFEYGIASSIDVIDANTLLVTAETQLADALVNYQLSIQRLKRTTGTLLKAVSGQGIAKKEAAGFGLR